MASILVTSIERLVRKRLPVDYVSAQISIWRQSATRAVGLTLLATCAIAINVHHPIQAVGNLLFTVPVTFLFWPLVCTFIVWLWRVVFRDRQPLLGLEHDYYNFNYSGTTHETLGRVAFSKEGAGELARGGRFFAASVGAGGGYDHRDCLLRALRETRSYVQVF